MNQVRHAQDAVEGRQLGGDRQAESAPKWPVPIAALARLLILIVPYALGRAYAGGWWSGMGLGDWPVDYAIDDYLYFGFVALSNATFRFAGDGVLTRTLGVVLGAVAVVVIWYVVDLVVAYAAAQRRRWHRAARRWLTKNRRDSHFFRIIQAALGTTFVTLSAMAVWLWLAIVLIMPVALAERVGRAEAARLRADLTDPERSSRYAPVTLTMPVATTVQIRLIQCTADWCVIGAGRNVHLVPKATLAHAGPSPLFKRPVPRAGPVHAPGSPEMPASLSRRSPQP